MITISNIIMKTCGLYNVMRDEDVAISHFPALRISFAFGAFLIVCGVALSVLVDRVFLALPLLVAGGLFVSAVFGCCPMERMIAVLLRKSNMMR